MEKSASACEADVQRCFPVVDHELEMAHDTPAHVRDMAPKQRDYYLGAWEELARRAKRGAIEFKMTDEMLANEVLSLDRFQEALRKAGG